MGLSNKFTLWGWEFLLLSQSPQVFSVIGFKALFLLAGTLGSSICLAPQLFLPVYPHANVGPSGLPPPPCIESSPPGQSVSAPSTSLDECFLFNSLVAGLPHISFFWEFWLFLNLLLSFFCLYEETQCVYLRLHLGWKSMKISFFFMTEKYSIDSIVHIYVYEEHCSVYLLIDTGYFYLWLLWITLLWILNTSICLSLCFQFFWVQFLGRLALTEW